MEASYVWDRGTQPPWSDETTYRSTLQSLHNYRASGWQKVSPQGWSTRLRLFSRTPFIPTMDTHPRNSQSLSQLVSALNEELSHVDHDSPSYVTVDLARRFLW